MKGEIRKTTSYQLQRKKIWTWKAKYEQPLQKRRRRGELYKGLERILMHKRRTCKGTDM